MTLIYVDADACPVVIKDILYRAATRVEVELILVANRHLPYDPTLKSLFRQVEEVGGDGAFRVSRAAYPLRLK